MYLLSDMEPQDYPTSSKWGHSLWDSPQSEAYENGWVYYPCTEDGFSLFALWLNTDWDEDKPITGVLCDWLQDHRDLLLSGAVGPNPTERLERVIDWFRQHFERGGYAHAG